MHLSRALLPIALLFQAACGLNGLWADIPPYVPKDTGDPTTDAGPDLTEEDTAPLDLTAPANPRARGVAAGVELEWDPVPGATGYEVRVEGGWVEVGDATAYLDADAPLGRLAGTLTSDASDATERDHVILTGASDVAGIPGDTRTYQIRATRPGEVSEASVEISGTRIPGEVAFTWQRATDEPPTTFEDLPDATTLTHLDATAPPDGSRTTYRVVASAEGASNEIESDGDEGWRLAAVQVAVGAAHSCALLSDGAVKCWGRNNRGQLGTGDKTDIGAVGTDYPPPTALNDPTVKRLLAGASNTCVVDAANTPRCWGDTFVLGPNTSNFDGTVARDAPRLHAQAPSGTHIIDIGFNFSSYMLLYSDGSLKCFGVNDTGVCGYESQEEFGEEEEHYPLPTVNIRAVQDIELGSTSTCALHTDGQVSCWGDQTPITGPRSGPPENITTGDELGEMPPASLPRLEGAIQMSSGGNHACVMTTNGVSNTVRCWGSNTYGQLGLGETNPRGENPHHFSNLQVKAIEGTGENPTTIETSQNASCVIDEGGDVFCWGKASEISSNEDISTTSESEAIQQNQGWTATQLASSSTALHFCATTGDGQVKCWGENNYNQLGLGEEVLRLDDPTQTVRLW